jgi:ParB family chromosome partitioning protein
MKKKPATKKPVPKKAPARTVSPKVPLAIGARKPQRLGGLGRGLDALIGRDATRNVAVVSEPAPVAPAPDASASRRVVEVAVDLVRQSPFQPRTVFDEDSLRELAESIKAHGIIQPLVCRRKDGFLELIGGERRLRAASLLGLKTVPVIVVDAVDRDAAELALVENLQREDLNAIEEAEGYRALADEFNLTQTDIAERVGKARASVANTLRLLELPDEVKQLIGEGRLSSGHAKVLLKLPSEADRTALARQCIDESITVRMLERRVDARLAAPARRAAAARPDIPPDHLRLLRDRLVGRFGAFVRLEPTVTYANGRHGRGRIEIPFLDNDDLTRILELLGIDVNE